MSHSALTLEGIVTRPRTECDSFQGVLAIVFVHVGWKDEPKGGLEEPSNVGVTPVGVPHGECSSWSRANLQWMLVTLCA